MKELLCLPSPALPAGPSKDITPQNVALPGSSVPQPPHTARQKEGCASSGAFETGLISSSASGTGRVWEVAAVAVAHAGSLCHRAGPCSTRQWHTAVLGSGSWHTTPDRAHPASARWICFPSHLWDCLLLPSQTWLHFGARWGADGFQLSPE